MCVDIVQCVDIASRVFGAIIELARGWKCCV